MCIEIQASLRGRIIGIKSHWWDNQAVTAFVCHNLTGIPSVSNLHDVGQEVGVCGSMGGSGAICEYKIGGRKNYISVKFAILKEEMLGQSRVVESK